MVAGRLVIAAVIALLAGAACVTAAGLDTANQDEADLGVPGLQPGDAAVYGTGKQLEFQNGFVVDEELIVRFSEEPYVAADGRMEPRLVMRHAFPGLGWGTKVWLDGAEVLA